jgi:predicted nucleic acid-binding protein
LKVVVDSNLLVALAVPTDYSAQSQARIHRWIGDQVDLFAPSLWGYEAISALRKFVTHERISAERAAEAVDLLLSLGVREVGPSRDLHLRALAWAERLGDMVAYDSSYLAVAESLEAPLWTADRRLVNKVRSLGIEWIHDGTQPLDPPPRS